MQTLILTKRGHRSKQEREVISMPWQAQDAPSWAVGYTRVFIPFTAEELKNAKGGKRGHIQVVRNAKLKPKSAKVPKFAKLRGN